jgi:hypothetical protein
MLQLPDGRTLWHRTRREVRTFAGRWPAVAGRFTTGEFPTEATELRIEGFLRAGNTFTVIAFQHAQPELVSIAPTFTPPSARRWTGGANTYRRGGPVELGRGRPTEEKESRKTELL